jgi:hypothetical protein
LGRVGGEKLKKCIIMQFFRRKTQKVHYSAVFEGGKRRKSVQRSPEVSGAETQRKDHDEAPASKCAAGYPSSQRT